MSDSAGELYNAAESATGVGGVSESATMRLLCVVLLLCLAALAVDAGGKSGPCTRKGYGQCGRWVCAPCRSRGLCCRPPPVFDQICYRPFERCKPGGRLTCLPCSRKGPGRFCCRRVTKAECRRKCKYGYCRQCYTGYCCK